MNRLLFLSCWWKFWHWKPNENSWTYSWQWNTVPDDIFLLFSSTYAYSYIHNHLRLFAILLPNDMHLYNSCLMQMKSCVRSWWLHVLFQPLVLNVWCHVDKFFVYRCFVHQVSLCINHRYNRVISENCPCNAPSLVIFSPCKSDSQVHWAHHTCQIPCTCTLHSPEHTSSAPQNAGERCRYSGCLRKFPGNNAVGFM